MNGRRGMLARILSTGRLTGVVGRIRARRRLEVPILAYHRIWDLASDGHFPYDVELISASTADFAWQVQYVRENFDPITFDTLIKILDGALPAPPRPLIMTFDDGYDDNYHHAFPILLAHGVPATVFLATGYIDQPQTFWYDRLAQLVMTAAPREIRLPGLAEPQTLPAAPNGRRMALKQLLKHLKQVPNEMRLAALRRLESDLTEDDIPHESPQSRPLNWNQVREMAAGGIEFGSHSVSHPILANLTDADLWCELTESRRVIEDQLRTPVQVISYPVGGVSAFDERVRRMARGAGYRLGVSYLPGSNALNSFDPFAVRRLHVERYTDRSYFSAMLNIPELFA